MAVTGKPLEGKVALITGGSRGIGAGIVRKLSNWGCDVCFTYVERADAAAVVADEIRASGGVAHVRQCDLAEPEDIDAVCAWVRDLYGHLDILVLNAAMSVFREINECSMGQWDYVFDTNVRSTFLLAQKAHPLLAGRHSRLITLSNNGVAHFAPRLAAFSAAKAAIESLTRSMAIEYARDQIVVNCLRPGIVKTDVFKVRPDFDQGAAQEEAGPWGRTTSIEDCADAVALLCLDEAKFICGQTIVLDGGASLYR